MPAQSSLAAANDRIEALEAEKAALLAKILAKTVEYQEAHDLCDDGVTEFLSEFGLEPPSRKVSWTITVEISVSATVEPGINIGTQQNDMDQWVHESLGVCGDRDGISLSLDNDWEYGTLEVSPDPISWSIKNTKREEA